MKLTISGQRDNRGKFERSPKTRAKLAKSLKERAMRERTMALARLRAQGYDV